MDTVELQDCKDTAKKCTRSENMLMGGAKCVLDSTNTCALLERLNSNRDFHHDNTTMEGDTCADSHACPTQEEKLQMKKRFYELFPLSEHGDTHVKLRRYITKDKYQNFVDSIKIAKTKDGFKAQPNIKYQLVKYVIWSKGGHEVFGKPWKRKGRKSTLRYDVAYEDLFDELYDADLRNGHHRNSFLGEVEQTFNNISGNVVRWYCTQICPLCMANGYAKNKRKRTPSIRELCQDVKHISKFRDLHSAAEKVLGVQISNPSKGALDTDNNSSSAFEI